MGNLRSELQAFVTEAAAIVNSHERPFEEQEEAAQTSARLVAALELREEGRIAAASSLRLECEELEKLNSTLRSEIKESKESHALFVRHMDKAEESAVALASR